MDDDLAYLEPGFNASQLTVPRLRNILVANSISYPSSAKKPELLEIFESQILSQAKQIRQDQSTVKRSERGIVNVSPGGNAIQHNKDADAVEEDLLAPLNTPAQRTSRRTTRAITEESVAPTPRTTRITRTTRQSTAPPTDATRSSGSPEEPDTNLPIPSTRNMRYSTTPTMVKQEHIQADNDSPFSQDNPFQSTNTPSGSSDKDAIRRRTTMGPRRTDDERSSRSKDRRRSEDAQKSAKQKTLSKSRRSLSRPSNSLHDSSLIRDEVSAGEEFSSDQETEVGKISNTRAMIPQSSQRQKNVMNLAPLSILTVVLAGLATVWRQEKIKVGYCGIGEPSAAIGGIEIPEWASLIRPQCEPCPQHAYCYADMRTVCEPNFVQISHPLSIGNVIPIPPTCEPDGDKNRKVKSVADFAIENELRERNAKYECGEIKSPELSVEELKNLIASKRSRKMSDEEFDELWDSAIGEIMGRDEVTSRRDSSELVTIRSNSLARISLGCAIRRSLSATIRQHVLKLVILACVISAVFYARHIFTVKKSTSSRAKTLAGNALEKLALQASLHNEDSNSYPESWISMVALRDDVLREEFNASERARLWEVVKGLVEGNANVRSMVREGRTGDVSRVWEWVGSLQRPGNLQNVSPKDDDKLKSEIIQGHDDRNRLSGVSTIHKSVPGRTRWRESNGPYY